VAGSNRCAGGLVGGWRPGWPAGWRSGWLVGGQWPCKPGAVAGWPCKAAYWSGLPGGLASGGLPLPQGGGLAGLWGTVQWACRVEASWAGERLPGSHAGQRLSGPVKLRLVGQEGVGLVGLQHRGLVLWYSAVAWVWRPTCSFNVSWCGEVSHWLGVQSPEVSALPCALPQPSVSPASQESPWFTEFTQSASMSQLPFWILLVPFL
jgi:hypothetical protein